MWRRKIGSLRSRGSIFFAGLAGELHDARDIAVLDELARFGWLPREYVAEVDNPIDEPDLCRRLAAGIEVVEDGESLVVPADLIGVDGQQVRLVVTEGKYRMVRRLVADPGPP